MNYQVFKELEGSVCVITGGTGVIGSAIARDLSAAGMQLAIPGRNLEGARKTAEDIHTETGNEVLGLRAEKWKFATVL